MHPLVSLVLSSEDQLWCDPAPIVHGEGFIPGTEVRVTCVCEDGSGLVWKSENGFLVTAQSSFDTGSTPGFGDDYYGVAAEGPIYSMRCQAGVHHDFVLPENGKIKFSFEVLAGGVRVWLDSVTRRCSSRVRAREEETVLFLHNDTPGAHCGARLLRTLGYTVKQEFIDPKRPNLDPLLNEIGSAGRVHLIASARAGEAGLELAQRTPKIASVTLFSGSGLRFTPWTIDGRETPYSVCDHSSLQARGRTVLSTREVYADAVADRDNRDRGRIEVENINCPVYLFTGSDDQVWPSAAFSELVAQRRGAHGLAEQTYHRTFPSVGHDLGPELGLPGLPTTERTAKDGRPGFRLSLGGKMGRQSRARRECWESLLEILGGKTPKDFREQIGCAAQTRTGPSGVEKESSSSTFSGTT